MARSTVAPLRFPGRSRSRFPVPGDGLARAASSAVRRRASAWVSSLARWAVARASVTLREPVVARLLVGVDADGGGVPCAFCAFFGPRGSFEYIALCLLWGFWCARRQAEGDCRARQDVATGEAGCHPKMRQDVAVHLCAHHKTACLLTASPLACHEAACGEPVKRRFMFWSGRRGSNQEISLLGRQIVARSPLSCFRLALEEPSPITCAIRAEMRQMVAHDGRQILICFPSHHTNLRSKQEL
jgi:hypothetical protein